MEKKIGKPVNNTWLSVGRTMTLPGPCIHGSPSICTGISDFSVMFIWNM